MEEIEIWRDIKGFENLYQISNYGRVKSLPKIHNCYGYKTYLTKEKILRGYPNSKGYLRVFLKKDKKEYKHFIHRLVAENFLENPDLKKEVNHIDHNILNNNINNLEWVSHQENMEWAWKCGRLNHILEVPKEIKRNTIKIAVEKKKRKVCMLDKKGNIIKIYNSMIDACKENGLDSGGLTRCCQGKQQTCKGKYWKYYDSEECLCSQVY